MILQQIQDAAKDFEAATTAKHNSLGVLYRIYCQADSNSAIQSEISVGFAALKSLVSPKKCKSDAEKIAWLAFPYSKQRVSDAKKLLEYAQEKNVDPNDFADWLKRSGGIRAILISLTKSSKDPKKLIELSLPSSSTIEKIAKHIYDAMAFDRENIIPGWVDGGNSHAQLQARATAQIVYAISHSKWSR